MWTRRSRSKAVYFSHTIHPCLREEVGALGLYLFPLRIIRCHDAMNFLKSLKRKKGEVVKGKMFSLGLCLFSKPNYSPATACYSEMRKKNALLWTRWEHSTWPNQSITLVGRRCDTAVQQHTISQSIRHKHMVTNQWHPEDPWGGVLLPSLTGSRLMTS